MIKVKDCRLSRFSNEEHFKFHTDLNGLIMFFTAATLMIVAEYSAFSDSLPDEEKALNIVRKSTISDLMHEADLLRDNTLEGFDSAIRSKLKHFNADVKTAATRLKVLRDSIGNVAAKGYDKESGAIIKLIADLKGSYASDVATANVGEWVTELENNNNAFDALTIGRYDEKDEQTRLRMKQVRVIVDQKYRTIIEKINALIIVNGEAAYAPFVNKLNLRIDSYTNNLSLHKAKTTTKEAPATSAE